MLRVQGLPVAVVAVCWMVFSVVMLAFPTAPGPTANEMNYMIVVFGGWIALCLVYYYFPVYGGVQWFNGPQTTLGHAGRAPSEETTGSANAMDDKQTVQV